MIGRRGAVAADRGLSGEALQEGHPRQGVGGPSHWSPGGGYRSVAVRLLQ